MLPARRAELARAHLARHARWRESAFAALNTAFLADGAFVQVPGDVTLEQPLEVVFVSTGRAPSEGPIVSHPRSLIVVEQGARAAVVETYAGISEGVYWTNAVTEVVVGEGARAELYRVQREGPHSFQVATTHSRQERDSYLGLHVMTLSGAQHADHHTVIDHAQPHCASHEFFNGVLGERAHGVFNGRIIVRPGAQRTDSKQTNNNLLLS